MSIAAELELGDKRIEFIADYVLKTLKMKPDRFTKMYGLDENRQVFTDFFEKAESTHLLIFQVPGGGLAVGSDWPQAIKSKACYFVKKTKDPIPKDAVFRNYVLYGDLSYTPIEQLSAFVEEVSNISTLHFGRPLIMPSRACCHERHQEIFQGGARCSSKKQLFRSLYKEE